MRYSGYLTGKIGQRIEKLHEKQLVALSLLDEVSVMQELAGQAVGNYERAMQAVETIEDLQQRMRIGQLAASYLIEVLNQVRDMTVAAARVADSGKQVDMMTVGSAIAQFMVLVEQEARTQLHDPDQFMQRMSEHANTQFMTVDQVAKTTLTPHRVEQEMRQMIESVPYVPPVVLAQQPEQESHVA